MHCQSPLLPNPGVGMMSLGLDQAIMSTEEGWGKVKNTIQLLKEKMAVEQKLAEDYHSFVLRTGDEEWKERYRQMALDAERHVNTLQERIEILKRYWALP